MSRRRPGYFWAWLDLYATMLGVITYLFIVAVVQVHPAAKPGVALKAEYLVQLTWPSGARDDLDLHLLMPDDRQLNFREHEVGWCVLDHDDIGTNGVYVDFATGQTRALEHREVATVRALVPGRYVANVHVYRRAEGTDSATLQLPYPARVTLTRLNPRVEELAAVDVPLERTGEQKTAFAFTVAEDGAVAVDLAADVPFIPVR